MLFADLIKAYPEHSEEAQERAAIMEYDGNLNRGAAEQETVRLIKWKYGLFDQGGLFEH